MGETNNTTTTSTAPANPAVTASIDKVLGGVNQQIDAGPKVFNEALYAGTSPTTQQGWSSALTAAGNPDFSSTINGALKSFGDAAAGGDYGMNDPGYATLRAKAADDAQTMINGQFNNSGRLGGGSANKSLGEGVTNAIAGMDYANFQNDRSWQAQAAQLLPGVFQSSLMPSTVQGQVGAAMDADSQAKLLARNDLFRRQNDGQKDLLSWGGSVLGGPAGAAGTTSTTTEPGTPWWQSALGLGIGAAGAFL